MHRYRITEDVDVLEYTATHLEDGSEGHMKVEKSHKEQVCSNNKSLVKAIQIYRSSGKHWDIHGNGSIGIYMLLISEIEAPYQHETWRLYLRGS